MTQNIEIRPFDLEVTQEFIAGLTEGGPREDLNSLLTALYNNKAEGLEVKNHIAAIMELAEHNNVAKDTAERTIKVFMSIV